MLDVGGWAGGKRAFAGTLALTLCIPWCVVCGVRLLCERERIRAANWMQSVSVLLAQSRRVSVLRWHICMEALWYTKYNGNVINLPREVPSGLDHSSHVDHAATS